MSQLQWNRFISSSLPRRRLCVAPRAVPPDQIPEEHGRPILAYQSDNGVFIADGQGRSIQVGSVDRDAYPPLTFAWSAQGLAWFGAGQVGVVADKSDRASLWPCHCSGVGWLGSSVFALEDDGEELLRFAPGDRWPERVPVTGPLGQEPSVLGTLGKTLVVAGYLGEPSRGTPNMLSLLGADGEVTRVPGKVHGVITGPTATAPDGKQVAFVSSRSGGACYFSTKVGILDFGPEGRPRVRFPAMPGHAWLKVVASLQISANGILSGTFWDMDCQRNESPPRPAPGERFELQGSRWVPTGERGGDIQRAGGLVALVTPEPEFNAGGRLTLGPAGEGTLLAESVTQIMMRP